MGDLCDMQDIERFRRCREGKRHLNALANRLQGKRIKAVDFSNDTCRVGLVIRLENGDSFEVFSPDLEVEALRETFKLALLREYYRDYPERKPKP
jgi:hypothetical protein